jgi:hypothetical protein
MDASEYCRDIEAYLCRKNDGHLIRIAGPSFEVVSRWAADGVPLKVAHAGIDRYFERYYRKGPRRRPVKIDFCEADVRDVFDEWRRATGITAVASSNGLEGDGTVADGVPPDGTRALGARRKGPSLPEHLERVMLRLSSLRATSVLGDDADRLVDRVALELETARRSGAALRGEARQALIKRLTQLDAELIALVRATADQAVVTAAFEEAAADLAAFRDRMSPDALAAAVDAAATRLLRQRLGLPVVVFG